MPETISIPKAGENVELEQFIHASSNGKYLIFLNSDMSKFGYPFI